jgi:hypothetical protein
MSNLAKKHTDLLSFTNSLQKHKPRPNCKLCNSPHLKDAIERYESSHSIQSVVNLLKERGEDIKYHVVRRHLYNCYQVDQVEQNMKDLAERLERWSGLDRSEEALLERQIELLDTENLWLAAENATLSPIEHRKNIELMIKIGAQINACKAQLRSIKEKMEPLEVLWHEFDRIVQIKIADAKSPEVRGVLNEIMEHLSKQVGEMAISGGDK